MSRPKRSGAERSQGRSKPKPNLHKLNLAFAPSRDTAKAHALCMRSMKCDVPLRGTSLADGGPPVWW
jgi:hypothetical protein